MSDDQLSLTELTNEQCFASGLSELFREAITRGWTSHSLALAYAFAVAALGYEPSVRDVMRDVLFGRYDDILFEHGQSRN